MSVEEAVQRLRADPAWTDLIRDSYLGADVEEAARRFAASSEFEQVERLVGRPLAGLTVLDLGAGTGIASAAFARAGARWVAAVEPDPSDVVGLGAARRSCRGLPVALARAFADALPYRDGAFDVVYARQVLHHVPDLDQAVAECARVLRPGGSFLSTREHVVDGPRSLAAFLASHPIHQLAGGEGAFELEAYLHALRRAGLRITSLLGPWDSIVNAFPQVRDEAELRAYPARLLAARLGAPGKALARVPGVTAAVRALLRARRPPGRLYTFIASK